MAKNGGYNFPQIVNLFQLPKLRKCRKLALKVIARKSVNFPTWKATNVKAQVCGYVFFVPVTPSVSELLSVCSDGCSAHCHQVHPVSFCVSLQASQVRGRLIPCMLTVGTEARTQNTRKYLECLKSIKGHMETRDQKKMEGDACFFLCGMFDVSIESCFS